MRTEPILFLMVPVFCHVSFWILLSQLYVHNNTHSVRSNRFVYNLCKNNALYQTSTSDFCKVIGSGPCRWSDWLRVKLFHRESWKDLWNQDRRVWAASGWRTLHLMFPSFIKSFFFFCSLRHSRSVHSQEGHWRQVSEGDYQVVTSNRLYAADQVLQTGPSPPDNTAPWGDTSTWSFCCRRTSVVWDKDLLNCSSQFTDSWVKERFWRTSNHVPQSSCCRVIRTNPKGL